MLLLVLGIPVQAILCRRWFLYLAKRIFGDEAQTDPSVSITLAFLLGWQAWLYRRRIPWVKFVTALACQVFLAPGALFLLANSGLDPFDEEPFPILAFLLISGALWVWGIVENLKESKFFGNPS